MAITKTELDQLYKKYVSDVYRFALFKSGDKETAEDITSETFLRVITKSDQLEQVQYPKAWLIGVTRNILFETYREKAKVINVDPEIVQDFPDTEVETEAVTQELIDLVKQNLSILDELTQEIIVLRVWEELPFLEISNLVELNESATKLRFYRGVEKLKDAVAQKETKAGVPLLLGALKLFGSEAQFVPEADFLRKLSQLLQTQFITQPMDTPKSSQPLRPKPSEATTAKPTNLKEFFQPVMTQQFLVKGFVLAALSALVVGGVAVISTSKITEAILNQPRPRVHEKIEVEAPTVEPDDSIRVDTSDWKKYTNAEYGVSFMHPADAEVEKRNFGDVTSFVVEYRLDDEKTTDLVVINAGLYEPNLDYLNTQAEQSDLGTLKIDGKNRTFKKFIFGEGAPQDIDENGNPTCVSGGGFINHFQVQEDYLVVLNEWFSTTDCNPEKKTITTGTTPLEKQTGIEVLKTIKLEGYDKYASWVSFEDKVLGIKSRKPAEYITGPISVSRFLDSTVELKTYAFNVESDFLGISFVQGTMTQYLGNSSPSTAVNDTDFGTFKLNGVDTRFKVIKAGEVTTSTEEGCNFGGYHSNTYFVDVRPGVFAVINLATPTSCFETRTSAQEMVSGMAVSYKPVVVGIMQNLTKIKQSEQFQPFYPTKNYTGTELSILYPNDLELTKVDSVDAFPDTINLSNDSVKITVGVEGGNELQAPEFEKTATQQISLLANNQVIKVTELWSANCNQAAAETDCVKVPFASFPKDQVQSITMQFALEGMTSSNNISSQFRKFEVTIEIKAAGKSEGDIMQIRNQAALIVSTLRDLK